MEDNRHTVLNQPDDSHSLATKLKRILEDQKFIRSLENTPIFVGSKHLLPEPRFFLASVIRA